MGAKAVLADLDITMAIACAIMLSCGPCGNHKGAMIGLWLALATIVLTVLAYPLGRF